MIEIKKLPDNRWKDYRDLRLEALMSDPTAFGSSYEEEIILPDEEWVNRINNVLFAILNNKLIGMIVYIFNKGLKIKHIANIYGVYVKKEYRNQGIGKKLLENAISLILTNKNIMKINLSVNPQQVAAVKLYEKYGFESVGVLKNDLLIEGKFYDEAVMEKYILERLNSY
jgi:ribosomal protein S18 acetylase RimI-like enzyme